LRKCPRSCPYFALQRSAAANPRRGAEFKRSPLPTSSRTTLRGRNIAATLHMRAGSHIGQPSGFLIWQVLAPLMPAAKSANHVATRHVPQRAYINTAEHRRARINLPLTNSSL
jgi:hypothetical protein